MRAALPATCHAPAAAGVAPVPPFAPPAGMAGVGGPAAPAALRPPHLEMLPLDSAEFDRVQGLFIQSLPASTRPTMKVVSIDKVHNDALSTMFAIAMSKLPKATSRALVRSCLSSKPRASARSGRPAFARRPKF